MCWLFLPNISITFWKQINLWKQVFFDLWSFGWKIFGFLSLGRVGGKTIIYDPLAHLELYLGVCSKFASTEYGKPESRWPKLDPYLPFLILCYLNPSQFTVAGMWTVTGLSRNFWGTPTAWVMFPNALFWNLVFWKLKWRLGWSPWLSVPWAEGYAAPLGLLESFRWAAAEDHALGWE